MLIFLITATCPPKGNTHNEPFLLFNFLPLYVPVRVCLSLSLSLSLALSAGHFALTLFSPILINTQTHKIATK